MRTLLVLSLVALSVSSLARSQTFDLHGLRLLQTPEQTDSVASANGWRSVRRLGGLHEAYMYQFATDSLRIGTARVAMVTVSFGTAPNWSTELFIDSELIDGDGRAIAHTFDSLARKLIGPLWYTEHDTDLLSDISRFPSEDSDHAVELLRYSSEKTPKGLRLAGTIYVNPPDFRGRRSIGLKVNYTF